MRQTYEDKIIYFDCGEEKEIPVKIQFVSNRASREYTELMSKIESFKVKNEEYQKALSDSGELIANRPEGYKIALKANEAKRDRLKDEITEFSNGDIINDRIKLIMMILKQNGHNDEMLQTVEFWDEQVESYEMMRFLLGCMLKDVKEMKSAEKKK